MTNAELKEKISEATEQEWFKTVSWDFAGTKITGLYAIYEFINQQVEGWEKYETLPNEFVAIKRYFTNIRNSIETFVTNISSSQIDLQQRWQRQVLNQPANRTNVKILTYNSPETIFLLKVYQETPNYFQGAYHFILQINQNQYQLNNPHFFYGAILAYEFTLKDKTEITSRIKAEQSSITALRNDFQEHLLESMQQLSAHLSDANTNYAEYTKKIDELKTEKESLFSTWFESIKNEQWQTWFDPTVKKVADLEETYKEKLKLEEPAKYWDERAKKLKVQGWWSLGILVGLVVMICVFLGLILWNPPEIFKASILSDDKSTAIKWILIYATLLSFLAYCIRALSKIMFSSFHLARDCEERHTLTYFYLSLLKDSKVADSDRQLIMQSLFSRADTGLLKEDSSPTMPNDMISKVIPK